MKAPDRLPRQVEEELKTGAPIRNEILHEDFQQPVLDRQVHQTEPTKESEELLESLAPYRSLFENNHAVMLLIDPETGEIVDANPAACSFYGYRRDNLLRLKIVDLDTLTADQLKAASQDDQAGQQNHFSFQHRLAGGQVRDVGVFSSRITIAGRQLLFSIIHDVTKRNKAEEALPESDAGYRAIVENTSNGVVVYRPANGGEDFFVVDFNKAAERIERIRKEEVVGKSVLQAFPGVREFGLFDVLKAVWTTGVPQHHPLAFYQDERSSGWRENYISRLPSGEIVAIYSDETQRKRAEEELKQANTYLENIFENSPDAIGIVDKSGRFIRWNKMAAELYGYTFEELRGKSAFDLYAHQTELERMLMHLQREGSVKKWEMRMKRRDGSVVPFEISIGLLRDGQNRTLGSVCVARDLSGIKEALTALKASHQQLSHEITERKQAEQAIDRLRRQNELILNSADEGILGLDLEGKQTFVNPAAARMLGYKAEELIGQKGHGLYHHSKDDGSPYPEEECPIYRAIRNGKSCPVTEEVFWRNDGTSFWVRYSSAPIIEDSRTVGAVITFRDITERKLAEREKLRLESHLRQAQKLEAIGTLAGGIAHDFNNILGIILGYTELTLLAAPKEKLAEQYLKEVSKAAHRASDLVKQILAFSRQTEQIRHPVHLAPIVKEALKLLRSSLPTTIEIRKDIAVAPEESIVLADPTQLHQVLMNLCTNAAHAMRVKGGVLSVKLSCMTTDASLVSRHPDLIVGAYVCLTVSDTGHGMDARVMERIFDPYFTTKAAGEGTGLGLAIVQGIVKSYGGAIAVYSELGQGTTFHVSLPRIEGKITPGAEVVEALPAGSERILFVDDEQALVEMVTRTLELLGYKVNATTSSIEALKTFRAQPDAFDLVITDMTMPGLTGKELAKELMALRANMPIILCTGFSELTNEQQAKKAGIREFVMKPYGVTALAKTIRKVLDKSQE